MYTEKHIAKQYSKNGAKGDATAVTKASWTRKSANRANWICSTILMHGKMTFKI